MKRWTQAALDVAALAAGLAAQTDGRAATEAQAAALGQALTPMGAEKGANKDGSIPAWTGGDLKAPAGWKPGAARPDPYAADKPLFSVDAGNADKYKDKLSEGQKGMFAKYATFRMDVYPTRRSASFPQRTYEYTIKNATTARLKAARYDELAGIDAVSKQLRDDTQAALKQAQADVAAATAAVRAAQIDLDRTRVTAPIAW